MRTSTFVLLILALLIVSTLAACGAAPTATPQPTATKAPAPTSTTVPAVAPTATKAAAAPTAAPAAGQPPNIPHALTGRENCLVCHAAGGVKPFPVATHSNYTVQQCQTCHKPKQ